MTPPENKPIPDDLFPMYVACISGSEAHRAGLPVTANDRAIAQAGATLRTVASPQELRLNTWAWDLGWREAAWEEMRAAERKRIRRLAASTAERLKQGRL